MGKILTCFGCRFLIYDPTKTPPVVGCKVNYHQKVNLLLGKIAPIDNCNKLSNHVARPKKIQIIIDDPLG